MNATEQFEIEIDSWNVRNGVGRRVHLLPGEILGFILGRRVVAWNTVEPLKYIRPYIRRGIVYNIIFKLFDKILKNLSYNIL